MKIKILPSIIAYFFVMANSLFILWISGHSIERSPEICFVYFVGTIVSILVIAMANA